MTWELLGLLAAACSLFSLGFLLCAVVTAPLLPEREEVVPRHLRVVSDEPVLPPSRFVYKARFSTVQRPAESRSTLYDWSLDEGA